ncbi:MAG: recombinase family protein [Chloroflexi bacterium]|nr:MAG: recombinase family protein [Chloroflexota bacterium]
MRVAIYARVSSESQEARGTIGSQLEVLRARIRSEGHELVAEFCDDGYSGARLDRPGLDMLRDQAEAGAFEAVWCLSPDRLARAYVYQVLVLDELAQFGVRVIFSDAPALGDDPQLRPRCRASSPNMNERRLPSATGAVGCIALEPAKSCPGRRPTAIGASPVTPPARPASRSSSQKPPWCGASSKTT